jgi:multidrug resistance efflux pump
MLNNRERVSGTNSGTRYRANNPVQSMSEAIRTAWAGRPIHTIPAALQRLLKLGAACGVLAAGGYAIWSAQGFVASDNAVVSAYLTSLRTPIEGYVSGRRTPVGAEIHAGDVLATMTNPLVDDQHLTDLEDRVSRLAQEEAAIIRQREALELTRRELLQRAEEHRRAIVAQLSGQVASADMALQAKAAEGEQAKHEYQRKAELARSNTASASDLDRAKYASEALDRQAQSMAGQLSSLQAQLSAASRGILTADGGNDVPYSVQRADEVRLRLVELDRALDTIKEDAQETKMRAAVERRRIDMLRSTKLAAPSAGMLWKVGASIGTGDTAAEVVDCSREFLVAAVPQKAYSNIILGGVARFRLSGEASERTGTIVSITGDTSLIGDRNLAAVPVDRHQPAVMVRIAMAPSPNTAAECLVGRTAQVLLPSSAGGIMSAALQLLQRIF